MRVLGFPLHVRPGFLIFMLLIVFLYGDEFGVWLAASIAGFTLLHELGHAVAARRAGATAEISLDFLAGYASYEAPRPLSRGTQAGIALAGPVTHITAGLLVLALMGVNPLEATSRGSTAAAAAVWWAGPVIGAFNLIPVLPLDGGNVAAALLDRVVPGRARPIMIYGSVVATAAAALVFAFSTQLRGFVVFLGLILLMQLQLVYDERARHAESPFDKAVAAAASGDDTRARKILVKGLTRPSEVAVTPRRLDDEAARRLLALLPRPLPHGDPWNEYVLTNLLLRVGEYEDAARYGAASFERQPRAMVAATVARAAGALGDDETAVAWLQAAVSQGTFGANVATVIDQAPELAGVRHRPDVVELRGTLHH
jgi:Zn-dependent protease